MLLEFCFKDSQSKFTKMEIDHFFVGICKGKIFTVDFQNLTIAKFLMQIVFNAKFYQLVHKLFQDRIYMNTHTRTHWV